MRAAFFALLFSAPALAQVGSYSPPNVTPARQVSTGTATSTGLSGGGALSGDLSLSCTAASGSSVGCVTTSAQTFAGVKTFNSLPSVPAGGGSSTVTPGGVLSFSSSSASNTTNGETNLLTYTLPASTLDSNGRGIRVTAWGTFAANANSKQIRLYFGSTQTLVDFAAGSNNAKWMARATILRTGATAQVAIGEFYCTDTNSRQGNVATPGETLSSTVLVKVTGQGTATNDITQTGLLIEMLN